MADQLLHIKNLSVSFSNDNCPIKTLNNINIPVNRSEIFANFGESGSGKSVSSLTILQVLTSPPEVYNTREILFRAVDEMIDL